MKKVAFIKTVILIIIFVNIFTVSLKLKLFADLNNIEQKIEQIKKSIGELPYDVSNEIIEQLISQCKEIIAIDSKDIDAYICLTICYYLKKDIDNGINVIEKVLTLDSKNPHGYFLRGFGYYGKVTMIEKNDEKKTNYLNRAILDLNKTVFLEPNYKGYKIQGKIVEVDGIIFHIGVCYKLKGDLVKAKETFQMLIDKYPNSSYTSFAKKELEDLKQIPTKK